ncbi:MAG: PIN domain-containing protein [Candidatus Thioglobus sp.]|uniref:PIN domain-containing protein n=1 Tax=Candidatus Thioglobus sp. TaxID=2026721 RepID=UPI002624D029|nr:PIN domain-containing protein [Candidatus Thioglobus sp.]MDC9727469.1 PIN domain-containing protein [Candidatus Thioglobus sp.]
MKEKVIFDTNFLYNKKATSFFGNKDELIQFEEVADIVIPEIVIEELKSKYARSFKQEKEKFFKTLLPNLIEHNTNDVIVDSKIKEIIDKETISYKVIRLENFDVLPEMKRLALEKLPPFEPSDGTDKGFKDTYIYFTILEYLQNITDKYVFVCVKDKRFKKAFDNHDNIYAIESYQEFLDNRIAQFQGSYFLEKLEENLGFKVEASQVKNFWHNIDDNKNVFIKVEDEEYIVEEDSGEIVSSSKPELYKSNIEQLVLSGNFETTHSTIEQLLPFVNYFSDEDILKIFNASFSNEQIKWIIEDEDVKEFIGTLYKAKSELVENDVADFLKENFL